MKYFILHTLILLCTLLPVSAQRKFDILPVKKIEANPINIAFILAQQTDPAKIASICTYYGYQPVSDNASLKTQDLRLKTYTHPNGSVIRYSFSDSSADHPYPYVEVKSKQDSKEVNAILTELNFKKNGSDYVRKQNIYSKTQLTCKHGPQGYWTFHKTPIKHRE